MIYTRYDLETGNILGTFSGSPEEAELNGPCIEGIFYGKDYRIIDGQPVPIADEEKQAKEQIEAWKTLRHKRNALLQSCDWTQVPDAPVDQAAWATYRQELRDLPSIVTDPLQFAWPTPPG